MANSSPIPPGPSKSKIFFRGATGSCGVCGKWRMSKRWLTVADRCPQCNFTIERKEGHFIGGVGINTIFTFGIILFTLLGGLIVTAGEPLPVVELSIITGIIGVTTSMLFYPISKTLWSAIDLMIVPLEPGEVDPRFDPTVSINQADASGI